MGNKKFTSITDSSIVSGECFAEEAKKMAAAGLIEVNDPRIMNSEASSAQPLLKTKEDVDAFFETFLSDDLSQEAKPILLLAQSIRSHNKPSRNRDMATCLERAAVRLHEAGQNKDNKRIVDLVRGAALICDSQIIRDRHKDEQQYISNIASGNFISPQRILHGMVRSGSIDHFDHRILSCVEGHLRYFNALPRDTFFTQCAPVVKEAIKAAAGKPLSDDLRGDIAKSISSFSEAGQSKMPYLRKEVSVLNASADLSEKLSAAFIISDPEKAKTLAAISISASLRGQDLRREHPEAFKNIADKKEFKGR